MRFASLITLVLALACGGAMDGMGLGKTEVVDPAAVALKNNDYKGADYILKERLAQEADGRSYRLLGDVNRLRGQKFHRMWKENLNRARDAYKEAVVLDPTDCQSWARLAVAVVAGTGLQETRVPDEDLEGLPYGEGKDCPAAPLLVLHHERQPSDEALEAATKELGKKASELDIVAKASPWLVDGYSGFDFAAMDWNNHFGDVKPTANGWFVVVDAPAQARGVGDAKGRTIGKP